MSTQVIMLLESFIDGDKDTLEVVCPEPGDEIDGKRFLDIGMTPAKMHQMFYGAALRQGWLKDKVWVQLKGRSVILHKHDYKASK